MDQEAYLSQKYAASERRSVLILHELRGCTALFWGFGVHGMGGTDQGLLLSGDPAIRKYKSQFWGIYKSQAKQFVLQSVGRQQHLEPTLYAYMILKSICRTKLKSLSSMEDKEMSHSVIFKTR